MPTRNRLKEIFDSSKTVDFDDSSKFILFSDCHRGDNSWSDDFAHNEKLFFHALNHYYNEGFTYIEIGDGDELWESKKFEEIRKAHSHIFWIMRKFHKDDRLFLIWGNHNIVWKNQKYIEKNLFKYYDERKRCIKPLFDGIEIHEGLILRHSNMEKKIFLFHGHQGDLMCDRLWRLSRFFVRHLWKHLQLLGIKDPTSPAKNFKKRREVERKIIDWVKSSKRTVICGHTHRPVFPNEGEPAYFNTGSCVHPRCITGIEIENGEIMLIKWWVKPKKDGALYVEREILMGPKKLQSFISKIS